MARIPPRATREVEALFRHFGMRLIRHGAEHDVWGPTPRGGTVSLPRARGSGSMPGNTVRGILRDAGIPVTEALAFWGIQTR